MGADANAASWSIFDPATLIPAIQQIKRPRTFIKDTFFAEVRTFDTEFVDVDLVLDKRHMAPIVSQQKGGKIMGRPGYQTDTYKPPLVAPRRVTTAQDVQKRLPGEAIFNGMSPADRAAVLLGKDLARLDDSITRREEWLCTQAMYTGGLILKGDDYYDVITFGELTEFTLTGSNCWDKADADPLEDLRVWKEDILRQTGLAPDIVVLAPNVYTHFVNNPKVQAVMTASTSASMFKVMMGFMKPELLPNGATFVCSISALGLDVYTYSEWYISDDDNATELPMIPDGTVMVASTRAGHFMAYGAYIDMELMGAMGLDKAQATMAMPRYPRSWVEKGPNVRYLEIDSRPLPVAENQNTWCVAHVLSGD